VRDRAEAAQVEVPLELLLGELVLGDLREELVEVLLALAAPDDLPHALRRDHVDAQDLAGVLRILLHVEGLHVLGVAGDHHRLVVHLREDRLVGSPEVVPGHELGVRVLQEDPRRLLVGDAREAPDDALELREVALEGLQLGTPPAQDLLDDVDDHVLGELADVVEVGEGHLGLEHPELGQVTARLRLLGTEGRTEAVDLAEREGRGLGVELARLGQEGLLVAEVVELEEGAGALARARGEHRRVDADEPTLVEEGPDRRDDGVTDPHHRPLALGSQPQVAPRQQEVGAVLLGGDRVVVRRVDDAPPTRDDLVAPGRSRVGLHLPLEDHARLLAALGECVEELVGHLPPLHDDLDEAGPVAQLDELQLALARAVVHPPAELDGLTRVLPEAVDHGDDAHGDCRSPSPAQGKIS